MEKRGPSIRWGVEQRLEFIEFRLYWEGKINRSDITEYFGVSVPQASKDLSRYQDLAPSNIDYDKSEKHYFATDSFKPEFLDPSADKYLNYLHAVADGVTTDKQTWLSMVPSFETLPLPQRNIDPIVLRGVLEAVRWSRSMEIRYQSMSPDRPKPIWRQITPHAFAHDGLRWHVRAYCHLTHRFKDFLLSRILKSRSCEKRGPGAHEDNSWNETTTVLLSPHPNLTPAQQEIVARDYGMKDQQLAVKMRRALLYYFLRRLNLDFEETKRSPREQHVVLANPDAVRRALDIA